MLSPYLRFGDLSPRYVDWRVCQVHISLPCFGFCPEFKERMGEGVLLVCLALLFEHILAT